MTLHLPATRDSRLALVMLPVLGAVAFLGGQTLGCAAEDTHDSGSGEGGERDESGDGGWSGCSRLAALPSCEEEDQGSGGAGASSASGTSPDGSVDASNSAGGCMPACDFRSCGPDGCGGTCGTCGADDTCVDGACSPPAYCAGGECGSHADCCGDAPYCIGDNYTGITYCDAECGVEGAKCRTDFDCCDGRACEIEFDDDLGDRGSCESCRGHSCSSSADCCADRPACRPGAGCQAPTFYGERCVDDAGCNDGMTCSATHLGASLPWSDSICGGDPVQECTDLTCGGGCCDVAPYCHKVVGVSGLWNCEEGCVGELEQCLRDEDCCSGDCNADGRCEPEFDDPEG